MGTEGVFPKYNGDQIFLSEYNSALCNACSNLTALENELENSMNLAKIQYTCAVSDIPHDYMIVDSFTDSSGYNDTINVNCSVTNNNTATGIQLTCIACCQYTCGSGVFGCFVPTVGNYSISGGINNSDFGAGSVCGYVCVTSSMTNNINFGSCVCIICFKANCYYCAYRCVNSGISNFSHTMCVVGSNDDAVISMSSITCPCTITNCYSYCLISGTTWNFYCNGTCKCAITLTAFPNICGYICSRGDMCNTTGGMNSSSACSYYCLYNLCSTCYISGTTSNYCNSGINGFYVSCHAYDCCPTVTSTQYCWCLTISGNCLFPPTINCSSGNNYLCTTYVGHSCAGNGAGVNIIQAICTNAGYCLDCVCMICFNTYQAVSSGWSNWYDTGVNYLCSKIISSIENTCSCITCTSDCSNHSITSCICYKLCIISAGCYCFYCNGVGKCIISINCFSPICFCTNFSANSSGNCQDINTNLYACISGLCYSFCQNFGKIEINNVCWSNPVKSVYYTDYTCGSGTRVYNVINATTGCCIACNVPINCAYLLSCYVCCHRYEIIQCNNAVSCIKSYAIAVMK